MTKLDQPLISDLLILVKNTGSAVMEVYDHYLSGHLVPQLADKPDQSPLTLADLAAHDVLVRGLARLTPEIEVVSEEDSNSLCKRTVSQAFWLLDPLDGTKEFLSKSGEFTVNLALVEGGRPVFGVVFAPAMDVIYWGGFHSGAYRKRGQQVESIAVSSTQTTPLHRVVASKSHLNQETAHFISRLGQADLVQAGSSLKFCLIAEGNADIYPRLGPTCEWDTAAAQAVLEGAGGHVVDLEGNSLRYGKENVLNPSFIATRDLGLIPA